MGIIAARWRTRTKEPFVTVTMGKKSERQIRIAFNQPLVERANLENVEYLVLDYDSVNRRLKFIPSNRHYVDHDGRRWIAHKLLRNKKTPSRILLVASSSLMEILPLGPYKPHFRGDGWYIELEREYPEYPEYPDEG